MPHYLVQCLLLYNLLGFLGAVLGQNRIACGTSTLPSVMPSGNETASNATLVDHAIYNACLWADVQLTLHAGDVRYNVTGTLMAGLTTSPCIPDMASTLVIADFMRANGIPAWGVGPAAPFNYTVQSITNSFVCCRPLCTTSAGVLIPNRKPVTVRLAPGAPPFFPKTKRLDCWLFPEVMDKLYIDEVFRDYSTGNGQAVLGTAPRTDGRSYYDGEIAQCYSATIRATTEYDGRLLTVEGDIRGAFGQGVMCAANTLHNFLEAYSILQFPAYTFSGGLTWKFQSVTGISCCDTYNLSSVDEPSCNELPGRRMTLSLAAGRARLPRPLLAALALLAAWLLVRV
uniref:Pherophorin domain-containing protein n=1 Tax=Chlamydomonas leiostraca TaxID=1034604 RepID=A0A7S0RDU4_9CHLO|mmetsp:Transcript_20361/g.51585  ORF Transcript_20361/g.51585 Transcript_20361/m.51585 type:complete len:342 (+) Transcript_20361:105-1130(+)